MPRIGERSGPRKVVIGIQHGGQVGCAEKRGEKSNKHNLNGGTSRFCMGEMKLSIERSIKPSLCRVVKCLGYDGYICVQILVSGKTFVEKA